MDSFLPILYCLKQRCTLSHPCVRLQNKAEAESLGQRVYASVTLMATAKVPALESLPVVFSY